FSIVRFRPIAKCQFSIPVFTEIPSCHLAKYTLHDFSKRLVLKSRFACFPQRGKLLLRNKNIDQKEVFSWQSIIAL
ncbi:hypothetical protein AB3I13_13795, partial [Enterococcus sp. C62]|uniref:hypothetical protein n=1 Tax=Enterococcus sp. C62 TaxID=3231323 RepID=UPI00349FF041